MHESASTGALAARNGRDCVVKQDASAAASSASSSAAARQTVGKAVTGVKAPAVVPTVPASKGKLLPARSTRGLAPVR